MHFITNDYKTLFKNQLDRSKATSSFNIISLYLMQWSSKRLTSVRSLLSALLLINLYVTLVAIESVSCIPLIQVALLETLHFVVNVLMITVAEGLATSKIN